MKNRDDSFVGEYGLNERRVVDVSSGICPCGPSKKVRAAIRKAVRDIRVCPDIPLLRFRKTVSSKLGIDTESLIFANSIEELLRLITHVFKPKKVLAAGPLLDIHSAALASSGAEVVHRDLWKNGVSREAETAAQGLEDSGLVFISQPNRITGCLADSAWLGKTLNSCDAGKSPAVVDESLIEFTDDPGNCERAAGGQGVIVLRTTANFYSLPGLELTYAVSSPEIIERLNVAKCCKVNTLAAAAARAAVRDRTYRQSAKKYVAEERKFLVQSLGRLRGFTCYDSDSNVLLLKAACSVDEMSAILARNGFVMTGWKTMGESGETIFRVSVMEHEKNVKFLRILKEAFGLTA